MQPSEYNSGSNVAIRKNVIQEDLKLSAERIVGNGAQTSNQNPIPSKKKLEMYYSYIIDCWNYNNHRFNSSYCFTN